LVNCTQDGIFSVSVTVLDLAGNAGTGNFSYIYDTIGPTFTASLPANSTVRANTLLTFTANEPIQPVGLSLNASGCSLADPTVNNSQTITVLLVSCTTDSPFSLNVTAIDSVGNSGNFSIDYVYNMSAPTPTDGVNASITNVTLQGSIQFTPNSTTTVSTSTQINIEGCATFGGNLTIQVTNLQQVVDQKNQTFIQYQCYQGGQFETITLQDSETQTTCQTEGNYLEQSFSALVKSCQSDASALTPPPPSYTGAIIGGVIGGVAFLALVAVLIICLVKPIRNRVFPNRSREMDIEMKDKKANRQTLGPDAIPSSVYDNQGKSGENVLYV